VSRYIVHSQEPLALSVIQSETTIRYLTRESDEQTGLILYILAAVTMVRSPENLVFNANLQEFAQRISYICNLETVESSPEESYQQIKALWEQLKRSKKQLRIGEDPFPAARGERGLARALLDSLCWRGS